MSEADLVQLKVLVVGGTALFPPFAMASACSLINPLSKSSLLPANKQCQCSACCSVLAFCTLCNVGDSVVCCIRLADHVCLLVVVIVKMRGASQVCGRRPVQRAERMCE